MSKGKNQKQTEALEDYFASRSAAGFKKIPLNKDPLRGAFGLAWYQRKPSSLSGGEWKALDKALQDGEISVAEYTDWKLNVK